MSDDPADTDVDGPRDSAGRFGPGNQFGRGCSQHVRLAALRRHVRDSVDPADLERAMQGMLVAAAAGDAAACRVAFEWSLGRPRQMEADVSVRLANLSTAQDFAAAFAQLATAAAAGEMPADVAAQVAGVLRHGYDASLLAEALEQVCARLADLEAGR